MAVGIAGVSARFRFKRQAGEGYLQTELTQHVVEDVVVMVAQFARHDLQRYVAVAKVITGAGEQERVTSIGSVALAVIGCAWSRRWVK